MPEEIVDGDGSVWVRDFRIPGQSCGAGKVRGSIHRLDRMESRYLREVSLMSIPVTLARAFLGRLGGMSAAGFTNGTHSHGPNGSCVTVLSRTPHHRLRPWTSSDSTRHSRLSRSFSTRHPLPHPRASSLNMWSGCLIASSLSESDSQWRNASGRFYDPTSRPQPPYPGLGHFRQGAIGSACIYVYIEYAESFENLLVPMTVVERRKMKENSSGGFARNGSSARAR